MQSMMQIRKALIWSPLLGLAVMSAGAQQVAPNGQATPPGAQNKSTGCTQDANGNATNTADPNCAGLGPGFVNPSINMPRKTPPRDVNGVVKVDTVLPKPAEPRPNEEMTFEGNTTIIKTKAVALGGCFSTGKRWSRDSGQATSTTCSDKKGNVIALEDCKPANGESPMTCSVVWPRQEAAKTQ